MLSKSFLMVASLLIGLILLSAAPITAHDDGGKTSEASADHGGKSTPETSTPVGAEGGGETSESSTPDKANDQSGRQKLESSTPDTASEGGQTSELIPAEDLIKIGCKKLKEEVDPDRMKNCVDLFQFMFSDDRASYKTVVVRVLSVIRSTLQMLNSAWLQEQVTEEAGGHPVVDKILKSMKTNYGAAATAMASAIDELKEDRVESAHRYLDKVRNHLSICDQEFTNVNVSEEKEPKAFEAVIQLYTVHEEIQDKMNSAEAFPVLNAHHDHHNQHHNSAKEL